jgi:hypothetical protein
MDSGVSEVGRCPTAINSHPLAKWAVTMFQLPVERCFEAASMLATGS